MNEIEKGLPEERLRKLIEKMNVCMLNTRGPDDTIHSRPMGFVEMSTDGSLFFFTHSASPKVAEIKHHHEVCVTFSDPVQNVYVTVNGRAWVRDDRVEIRRLFTPMMNQWFAKGAEDPEIRLLVIEPDAAEYWQGPSSLSWMLRLAKLTMTPIPVDQGEHGAFSL